MSSGGESMVEVRVPTHRRPALLKRALLSLIAQTHADWHALVIDDSPDREGEKVAQELADSRIQYQANGVNLGADGNLNKAFRKASYFEGARYFCVVEDDNYLLPECLAANIAALEQSGCKVMLREQEFARCDSALRETRTGHAILAAAFTPGNHEPAEFVPRMLYSAGVSNGALFWERSCATDFEIHFPTVSSVHQEKLRAWFLRDTVCFAPEPLAVFTFFPEATGPSPGREHNRRINRGTQSLALRVLREIGGKGLDAAKREAAREGYSKELGEMLACAFRWPPGGGARHLVLMVKSAALFFLYPDPYAELFRQYPRPLSVGQSSVSSSSPSNS